MTVVAGHVTAGRPAPILPPAEAPGPAGAPAGYGVELLGEYQGSGYAQPPSLVRRPDGQVIQTVSCATGGLPDRRFRDPAAIADLVSGDLGRSLTAGQVPLPHHRQAAAPGRRRRWEPPAPRRRPTRCSPCERGARAVRAGRERRRGAADTAVPGPVVVAVLVSSRGRGLAGCSLSTGSAAAAAGLRDPVELLIVLGLTLVSAVFTSAASATRPGAATAARDPAKSASASTWSGPRSSPTSPTPTGCPGPGGCAPTSAACTSTRSSCWPWPAVYAATSSEILLLVIAVTHLEMLEQLMPFAASTVTYLSDLIGVPDLFARVVPILNSALPGRPRDPRVTGLRRRARIMVTTWVACVIPLLANGQLWVPRAVPARRWNPGALALGERPGPPPDRRRNRAPLRDGCSGRDRHRPGSPGRLPDRSTLVTGLARRYCLGLPWSAGRPARRLLGPRGLAGGPGGLAAFWTLQGEFRGW